MQEVNKKTKLDVNVRIQEINRIIKLLNMTEKDLIYTIHPKPMQFPGTVMGAPKICLDSKKISPDNGLFNLRDKIKDPITLKTFYFIYSKRTGKDVDDADATMELLQKASKSYGINVKEPIWIQVSWRGNKMPTVSQWIE